MNNLLPLIIWLAAGSGFYPPPDRLPERGEGRLTYKQNASRTKPMISLPDLDDDNLENQMEAILQSDTKIQQQLALLIRELSGTEKMALGLNTYFLIDETSTQLCDLKPKHGEYPAKLQSGILLVQQLSPQAKAEFANDILLEDWEMDLVMDSPSTLIE